MAGKLTRENLREAFVHMGELLARRRVVGEIAVFGGSAIMLQMEYRHSTEDVDCIVKQGHGEVMKAMLETGRKLNIGTGWLNEGVSIYMSMEAGESDFIPFGAYPSANRPFLRVLIAKPDYLLAMKIEALERASGKDHADVAELANALGVRDMDGALQVHRRFFPKKDLHPDLKAALRGILASSEKDKEHVDRTAPKHP